MEYEMLPPCTSSSMLLRGSCSDPAPAQAQAQTQAQALAPAPAPAPGSGLRAPGSGSGSGLGSGAPGATVAFVLRGVSIRAAKL